MAEAQQARDKRDGVYQSGIGMEGGYTTDEMQLGEKKNRCRNRGKKKTATDKVCPHCNRVGHVRKTSRKCDYYQQPVKRAAVGPGAEDTPTEAATASLAADEVDDADALPLSDSASDDFFDAKDEFTSESD